MRAIILATVITITMGIVMADPIDEVKVRSPSTESDYWSDEYISFEESDHSSEESDHSSEESDHSSEESDHSSEETENSVIICAVTALSKLVSCFKNGFNDKAITCMVTEVKELIACFKKGQRNDIYDYDIIDKLMHTLRPHH